MTDEETPDMSGDPQALAEMFLDGRMGTAHPKCEAYTQALARHVRGLIKSDSRFKRNADRRGKRLLEAQDKLDRQRHEIRRLEDTLMWIHRTQADRNTVREVIAKTIPRKLARTPEVDHGSAVEDAIGLLNLALTTENPDECGDAIRDVLDLLTGWTSPRSGIIGPESK